MNRSDIYHSDPDILGGIPVFTGTRVPVDSLLAHLRAGDSVDDFLEGFPSVRREQVEAYRSILHRRDAPAGRLPLTSPDDHSSPKRP